MISKATNERHSYRIFPAVKKRFFDLWCKRCFSKQRS